MIKALGKDKVQSGDVITIDKASGKWTMMPWDHMSSFYSAGKWSCRSPRISCIASHFMRMSSRIYGSPMFVMIFFII